MLADFANTSKTSNIARCETYSAAGLAPTRAVQLSPGRGARGSGTGSRRSPSDADRVRYAQKALEPGLTRTFSRELATQGSEASAGGSIAGAQVPDVASQIPSFVRFSSDTPVRLPQM
jgi:hypothetical protein